MDQQTQDAAQTLIGKAKELFKNFINKTRLPSVVDLVFKPTIKEALDNAPVASQNWVRLGLEKSWKYFAILAIGLLIYFGKSALQFAIEIISQFGFLAILFGLGYWLWKSIK